MAQRVIELKLEHRDLDAAIARLQADADADELTVKRLKKRKLQLKDCIAKLESGLIFSIVCRNSRPRMMRASFAQASRRSSNISLPFSFGHTRRNSRIFWMKPRNSVRSKNSGAAGAYNNDRRCAASWHRLSSSP